jgi:hypothetical protein
MHKTHLSLHISRIFDVFSSENGCMVRSASEWEENEMQRRQYFLIVYTKKRLTVAILFIFVRHDKVVVTVQKFAEGQG